MYLGEEAGAPWLWSISVTCCCSLATCPHIICRLGHAPAGPLSTQMTQVDHGPLSVAAYPVMFDGLEGASMVSYLEGSFLGKPNIWVQPGDLKRSTIGRISSHLGLSNVQLRKTVTNKILLLLLLKMLLPVVFSEIRYAVFFNRELFKCVLVPLCSNFLFVSLFCLPVTLLFLFLLALEQYFVN